MRHFRLRPGIFDATLLYFVEKRGIVGLRDGGVIPAGRLKNYPGLNQTHSPLIITLSTRFSPKA
jgi:hypothetical protein